jgi:uncharacterized protein YciI
MTDTLYVAVSEYQVPTDEIDPHLDEHREWALEQYVSGRMLASGRRTPPVGGVLVFRAQSQSDAERFVSTDPFVGRGFTAYTVYAFAATPAPWRSSAFASFVDSPLEP